MALKTVILAIMYTVGFTFTQSTCPCAHTSSEPAIKTMQDVPEVCLSVVTKLAKQPDFNGTGNIPERSKIFPLKQYRLCRIVEIINENATKKLGLRRSWQLNTFRGLKTSSGEYISQGLSLWLHPHIQPCSLDLLHDIYRDTTQKITHGWVKSDPVKFPDILHTQKDPENWYFFIKEKSDLIFEDTLIRFLAAYMNIEESISCHNTWKTHPHGYKYSDTLYLWIKKESYESVAKAFQLPENLCN